MTTRVAALVLAAGRSSRMGRRNKLVASIAGRPLVARVVSELLRTRASPVLVVTGCDAEVRRVLPTGASVLVNPEPERGLASSIRTGVGRLSDDLDGVLVCLGDMPFVRACDVDRLIEAFDGERVVVPVSPAPAALRGNPVLFPRRLFSRLGALRGDRGARGLVLAEAHVLSVTVESAGPFVDVDTPEDLRLARRRAVRPDRSAPR